MINFAPRKILITGSTGLIGSAITKHAISSNFNVLAHSRKVNTSLDNYSKVKQMIFDLRKSNEIFFDKDVDTVIHTATSNEHNLSNLKIALQNTFSGTLNLLNKCLEQKVQKFVYISTAQLYCAKSDTVHESDEIEFNSIYTKQHYLTEQLLRTYADKFEQGINIMRVANVFSDSSYALSKRSNLVPTCFIKSGLNSRKILLLTNGEQKKNFIFDADVGAICIKTLALENSILKIINVASHYTPSIIELAEMTQQEFADYGYKMQIEIISNKSTELKSQKFISNFYCQPAMLDQQELMRNSIRKLIAIEIGQKI